MQPLDRLSPLAESGSGGLDPDLCGVPQAGQLMNETTDLLHVARPGECNVQQQSPSRATSAATVRATTPLRAAALRVLARNRACNTGATTARHGLQQAPAREPPPDASKHRLEEVLAEINGLIARLTRRQGFGAAEEAKAHELAACNAVEALQCLRALAEIVSKSTQAIILAADDRITCRQCARRIGEFCGVDFSETVVDQPRRCLSFKPRPDAGDQRAGRQRWPWLREAK